MGSAAAATLVRIPALPAMAEQGVHSRPSVFGLSSLSFGAPGPDNAVELTQFFRAGGFREITPTQAKLWWDADQLHAKFVNTEPDPLYRGNPGLAKPVHYPENDRFAISAYPDAVYIQFRPDWTSETIFLFAVDSSGARNRSDFDATVERAAGQWTVHFGISWDLMGGRPQEGPFGLNLVRSRGQSSELLSPVVLDQTLHLPSDLLLSCQFAGRPVGNSAPGFLIALPDGTSRWQLPGELIWPNEEERRWLWQEQTGLARPTTPAMLSERVRLAQRMHDMLVLEGHSFHTDGSNWPVAAGEFYPHEARMAVNRSLCERDLARACAQLDIYLEQLDRASRRWFADQSPGNIRADEWTPVALTGSFRQDGNEVRLEGRAAGHPLPLWLSLCEGAVRIRGEKPGFFLPQSCDTLVIDGDTITAGQLQVRLEHHPWRIIVSDNGSREVWSLGDGDLRVHLSASGVVTAIDISGPLSVNENLFGFGERFNALGQRGNVVTLWDVDCWDGNIHGQLNQAYKNVPLVHSTAGYSLFWNTTYRLRADVGNTAPDRCRMTAFGDILDLYVWPAPPTIALASYLRLTGMPMLPPPWVFEPWMGGGGRRWSNGPLRNAVREEIGVVEKFRQLDIPHSALYAEAGNADPELYKALQGTDLHILAWDWASMQISRVVALMPDVSAAQLPVLRHTNGETVFRSEENAILDYTHPQAPELIRRFWAPRLELGLAGSMVDFGDMVPDDAVFHDGHRGTEMHDFYALSYHRTFAQIFQEKRGQDYVLFARSGCAGDQASICHFAGDHQANFFGMRAALRGGLNAAACGFSSWGADAGGYAGWPDPEVYIRWTQWATFCPLMRFHGTTPREPWEYGEQAVVVYRKFAWLRENLLPYIEEAAKEAHEKGVPILRPMPMAYPDLPNLAQCDDEYLFGPDLLIAPMLGPGASRSVVLPPGIWTDFWTGDSFPGGRTIEISAPIDRIGVLLRPGACVPLDLAPSCVPGDSMSEGRIRAMLIATPEDKPVRISTEKVSSIVVYGGGVKRVLTVEPGREFLVIPPVGKEQ